MNNILNTVKLPANSRLWIYFSPVAIPESQLESATNLLSQFCKEWHAHHLMLNASFQIIENKFILLSVDEGSASASGCSIDSSVKEIKKIGEELQLNFINPMLIPFLDNEGNINSIQFNELESAILDGIITKDTLVFNNTITNTNQLHNEWIIPFSKYGLATAFAHVLQPTH